MALFQRGKDPVVTADLENAIQAGHGHCSQDKSASVQQPTMASPERSLPVVKVGEGEYTQYTSSEFFGHRQAMHLGSAIYYGPRFL